MRIHPAADSRRLSSPRWMLVLSSVAGIVLAPVSPEGSRLAAQEEGALEVLVRSQDTGEPLATARVRVLATSVVALTDRTGRALLTGIPPGARSVEVSRVGYSTAVVEVAVEADRTARLQVPLSILPVPIEGVAVTATVAPGQVPRLSRAGFYRRQRTGFGTFLQPVDIEARRTRGDRLSDALRDVPGLYLEPVTGGGYVAYASRGRGISGAPCPMPVFVDGVRLPAEPTLGADRRNQRALLDAVRQEPSKRWGATNVDRVIPLLEVDAVEVYAGQTDTPLEFQVPPVCGAIVIWTRSGPR